MSRPAVTTVKRCCKAEGIATQWSTYLFARTYLCAKHGTMWDLADIAAHRGGTCPWFPKPCGRCLGFAEEAQP